MKDVTKQINLWAACCTDVWKYWFVDKIDNAEDEFIDVEDALFATLVLSQVDLIERPQLYEAYTLLTGQYKCDIAGVKPICTIQKAGNIYCSSSQVTYEKGKSFAIRSIDFKGRIIGDGKPCVELLIDDNKFVVEALSNLQIYLK